MSSFHYSEKIKGYLESNNRSMRKFVRMLKSPLAAEKFFLKSGVWVDQPYRQSVGSQVVAGLVGGKIDKPEEVRRHKATPLVKEVTCDGSLVYALLSIPAGMNFDDLMKALPDLENSVNRPIDILEVANKPAFAKLQATFKNPLNETIFWCNFKDQIEPYSLDNSAALPVGLKPDLSAMELKLFHTLFVGDSGSGKSAVHTLMRSFLAKFPTGEVIAIDPKQLEFSMIRGLDNVQVFLDVEQASEGIEVASEKLAKRKELFSGNSRNVDFSITPPVLVLIDEFSVLAANRDFLKKSGADLERILREGRAFGIFVMAFTQSPQKEFLTKYRDLFTQTVGLYMSKQNTETLIGNQQDVPLFNLHLAGEAYGKNNSSRHWERFRFAYVSDAELENNEL